MGGFLVKSVPRLPDFDAYPLRAVLLSVATVCVGISALISLRTVAPRLRTGEARSLVYFDHIARRYPTGRGAFIENYVRLATDEGRFLENVIEQVWANSLVARRKFRRVSYAVTFLGLAMVTSGLAVIVHRAWDL
ncbi:hypothetical protein BU204_27070 [Actinophytocola xanthii]|uniref:Pycsar effector protein domain-containing protein n=1 Tax=Actinophytocola xanthii TaxID=1912961 RepID=A0A1Q8CGL8_9PSEU|nr:hypothetical protein BU204_27070 [Actinophytocola xanthii]